MDNYGVIPLRTRSRTTNNITFAAICAATASVMAAVVAHGPREMTASSSGPKVEAVVDAKGTCMYERPIASTINRGKLGSRI
jgi:anthranilate phosphoribosyltransferase